MDFDLGKRLAAFRKQYDVTMPAIAKATGISRENLYKWEKGVKPRDFNEYRKLEAYIRGVEETGSLPLTQRRRGAGMTDATSAAPEDATLTIPNVHLVVHFTEDSMVPLFKPGCRLCLRKVPHPRSLVWGNVYYFVDLNEKGILRRVYPTDEAETLRLLSCDPEQYPVILRRYGELLAVYEVIGLLFL